MIFSSKDCVLRIRKIIVVGLSGPPVKGGGKISGGGGRRPPPGKFPEIFFGNFRKFPEKFPAFTSLNIHSRLAYSPRRIPRQRVLASRSIVVSVSKLKDSEISQPKVNVYTVFFQIHGSLNLCNASLSKF
jgi:hypothetical protein